MKRDSRDAILSNLKSKDPTEQQVLAVDESFESKWPLNDQASGVLDDDVKETLKGLSVHVEFHKDDEGIQSFIIRILEENNVHTCVAWKHFLLDRLNIPAIVRRQGVQYRDSFKNKEDFTSYCSQADLGITAADAIIGQSGTIVLRAGHGLERSTSLLPPIYLAIVQADKAISTIREISTLLRYWSAQDKGLPSAIHLVTGPSRTADIEFNLVLGVHGPKKVYMLVNQ